MDIFGFDTGTSLLAGTADDYIARWAVALAAGMTLMLSVYVISAHIQRWRGGVRKLLPLHVWTIAVAYNLIVMGMLLREVRFSVAFLIYYPGILLGIWSLLVLARSQREHTEEVSGNLRRS